MKMVQIAILMVLSFSLTAFAAKDPSVEIVCSVRDSSANLNCVWVGQEKKPMTSDDVQTFIDAAGVYAYITVKSRKGLERSFMPDPNSAQFKKLADIKKNGSISEISRAKLDLFAELEKKVVKLSDELDSQALSSDLLKYDASVTGDKLKREMRAYKEENESLRAGKGQACTSTPEYEQKMRVSSRLQGTISTLLNAFQTPGTCLDQLKVKRDKDGKVDVGQFENLAQSYIDSCKK
jgi:hypothetical protein